MQQAEVPPPDTLASIRLAVFDFDGVFTDNHVWVDGDGSETVRCCRADGLGLVNVAFAATAFILPRATPRAAQASLVLVAASVLLPLRAGASRATSAILSGDARSAVYWQEHGVVELLAPEATLAAAVDAWFERTFVPKSAEALRHVVRAVRLPVVDAVTRQLPLIEQLYLHDLMRSEDAAEGVRAFLEKRNAEWKDT